MASLFVGLLSSGCREVVFVSGCGSAGGAPGGLGSGGRGLLLRHIAAYLYGVPLKAISMSRHACMHAELSQAHG